MTDQYDKLMKMKAFIEAYKKVMNKINFDNYNRVEKFLKKAKPRVLEYINKRLTTEGLPPYNNSVHLN